MRVVDRIYLSLGIGVVASRRTSDITKNKINDEKSFVAEFGATA
jgi:hypothetical protein